MAALVSAATARPKVLSPSASGGPVPLVALGWPPLALGARRPCGG
jgi:hypothetical protein